MNNIYFVNYQYYIVNKITNLMNLNSYINLKREIDINIIKLKILKEEKLLMLLIKKEKKILLDQIIKMLIIIIYNKM